MGSKKLTDFLIQRTATMLQALLLVLGMAVLGRGKLDHDSADLKLISSQGVGADSKPRSQVIYNFRWP